MVRWVSTVARVDYASASTQKKISFVAQGRVAPTIRGPRSMRSVTRPVDPDFTFAQCQEEIDMPARRMALLMLGALLLIAPVSFAQQFAEWESKQDLFAANFPGVPTMTSITWETEYGARIPARVYRATLPGPRTYSVTVVNYNPVQQILTERAKSCPPGAERCSGDTSFPGAGYWKNDVRGAMIYAAAKYMKGDFDVTHYAWSFMGTQAVENNELQLVNKKDKSRTYVNIF